MSVLYFAVYLILFEDSICPFPKKPQFHAKLDELLRKKKGKGKKKRAREKDRNRFAKKVQILACAHA